MSSSSDYEGVRGQRAYIDPHTGQVCTFNEYDYIPDLGFIGRSGNGGGRGRYDDYGSALEDYSERSYVGDGGGAEVLGWGGSYGVASTQDGTPFITAPARGRGSSTIYGQGGRPFDSNMRSASSFSGGTRGRYTDYHGGGHEPRNSSTYEGLSRDLREVSSYGGGGGSGSGGGRRRRDPRDTYGRGRRSSYDSYSSYGSSEGGEDPHDSYDPRYPYYATPREREMAQRRREEIQQQQHQRRRRVPSETSSEDDDVTLTRQRYAEQQRRQRGYWAAN